MTRTKTKAKTKSPKKTDLPKRLERLVRQRRRRCSTGWDAHIADIGRVRAEGTNVHGRQCALGDVDTPAMEPHIAGFAEKFVSESSNIT